MRVTRRRLSETESASFSSRVPLDWCNARTPSHRSNLSVFRCTDPEGSHFDDETGVETHDCPWEFEVQDHIRRLHVPAHPPEFLLLGYDSEGLAAVLEMKVWPLDRFGFIRVIAVAQRAKGRGFGSETIEVAHRLMQKHQIVDDYYIETRIDPDNQASKSLFERNSFSFLFMEKDYEQWGLYVPTAHADAWT